MPELPEVESLRLGLERYLPGLQIRGVEVRSPRLVVSQGNIRTTDPKKTRQFIRGLTGQTFASVERRAKNLIFHFRSGRVLLVHLKMTGQFVYRGAKGRRVDGGHPIEVSEHKLPNSQTRLIFHLSRGTLYYNDTRQFGYLLYYPSRQALAAAEHFTALGPEPLSPEFTVQYFETALRKKTGVLKSVLLGQEVVTGLGNIYCDEVCFAAGVRPTRRVPSLRREEIKKLYTAIRRILMRAIKAGGSSVSTYRLADGSRGNYARQHKVYGKSGQNCKRCGTPLRTVQVQSRTTVFCPKCQK